MIRPRSELFEVPLVPHGGKNPTILDFSANLNPFGASPAVERAVRAVRWDTYPDPDANCLRRLLADRHQVSPEEVLVGNGCSELIDLACRAFVGPADRVAIIGPTYGEYERSARLCGATCGSRSTMGVGDTRALFLCTPNNPTGEITPIADLVVFAELALDTLVIADESYADCIPAFVSVIPSQLSNVLVLRSLTKAHGLAGLRVGYAIGPPLVIEAMRRVRVPWGVNAVAQAAAVAAVQDENHIRCTVGDWIGLRDQLVAELRALGLAPRVAAAPFFLLPGRPGEPWATRLRRHDIAVRDCTSFGLPGFARISPRLKLDNNRLLEAIRVEIERP
jgi:histidinol-phosphate aminotransferase